MTNSTIIAQANSSRDDQQRRPAVDADSAPTNTRAGHHLDERVDARRCGVRQVRQRPRSASQLTTGTFSYHDSARLQVVQCDAGQIERLAPRQPVDADVEEAADTEADQREHDNGEGAADQRGTCSNGGGSTGNGLSGEPGASVITPRAPSSR